MRPGRLEEAVEQQVSHRVVRQHGGNVPGGERAIEPLPDRKNSHSL